MGEILKQQSCFIERTNSAKKRYEKIWHEIQPEIKEYTLQSTIANNRSCNHVIIDRTMHQHMNEQEYNDYSHASRDLSKNHPTIFYGPLIMELISQKMTRVQIIKNYDLFGQEFKRIYIEYNSIDQIDNRAAMDKYKIYIKNENKELKFYNLYKDTIPKIKELLKIKDINVSAICENTNISEPTFHKIKKLYIKNTKPFTDKEKREYYRSQIIDLKNKGIPIKTMKTEYGIPLHLKTIKSIIETISNQDNSKSFETMIQKIDTYISLGLTRDQILKQLGLLTNRTIFKRICIKEWGKRDFKIYLNDNPGINSKLNKNEKLTIINQLGNKAYDYYCKKTNPELLFISRYKTNIELVKAMYLNKERIKKRVLVKQLDIDMSVVNKIVNYTERQLTKDGVDFIPFTVQIEPKPKIKKEKIIKIKKEKIPKNNTKKKPEIFTKPNIDRVSLPNIEKILMESNYSLTDTQKERKEKEAEFFAKIEARRKANLNKNSL